MANIMMTDICNLRCPYCFANEFVNKDSNEISEENFDKAVDFIIGDGTHKTVGLIGGEPTLHSKFDILLRKLIRNCHVHAIVVYTNGILLDKYWDLMTNPKVHLLINCNSPSDIGGKCFQRMERNLDKLFLDKQFHEQATLGINMYSPMFQFDYLLTLLKRYDLHRVRVSLTVPNTDAGRNVDAHLYFKQMKPRMFEFFHALLSSEIIPNFDCNKIPHCLLSEDDLLSFKKYLDIPFIRNHIQLSNINNIRVRCRPVIDIRQDLTAVRCFGLSEYTKTNIEDFKSISDLELYYIGSIDAFAYNSAYSSKCADCYERKVLSCTGGCLAFKIRDILALQEFAQTRMGE